MFYPHFQNWKFCHCLLMFLDYCFFYHSKSKYPSKVFVDKSACEIIFSAWFYIDINAFNNSMCQKLFWDVCVSKNSIVNDMKPNHFVVRFDFIILLYKSFLTFIITNGEVCLPSSVLCKTEEEAVSSKRLIRISGTDGLYPLKISANVT